MDEARAALPIRRNIPPGFRCRTKKHAQPTHARRVEVGAGVKEYQLYQINERNGGHQQNRFRWVAAHQLGDRAAIDTRNCWRMAASSNSLRLTRPGLYFQTRDLNCRIPGGRGAV